MNEEGNNVILEQHEQENVDVLQKIYAALDNDDIQGVLAYLTDDVECRILPVEVPFGGVFHGLEGLRKFFENLKETFKYESVTREQVVRGDKIIVFGHEQARIMPLGNLFETDFVAIYSFRQGKLSKIQVFGDGVGLVKAYRGE